MNSRQSRILVVDDDDDMRAIATEIFNHAGYEVVTAASGHEADQVLANPDFVAAVVDLVLPDTSGLQVLERVRNENADTVLVVITGYASLDSAMEAVRLGAYDYLRKPFTADELLRVVQQGVKERELAEQHRQLLAQLDQANRELLEYRDRLEAICASPPRNWMPSSSWDADWPDLRVRCQASLTCCVQPRRLSVPPVELCSRSTVVDFGQLWPEEKPAATFATCSLRRRRRHSPRL